MTQSFIENGVYHTNIAARHKRGQRMKWFYMGSLLFALLALVALMLTIINGAFGLVAVTYDVQPEEVTDRPLSDLNETELTGILLEYQPNRMLVYIRDEMSRVASDQFVTTPLSRAIDGDVPEAFVDNTITELSSEEQAQIVATNLSKGTLIALIDRDILKPVVQQSWELQESLLNRAEINSIVEDQYPMADLSWRSWVNSGFVGNTLSNTPALTGIRPALIGSIYLMLTTIAIAFPLGVGAAIYLQEYAADNWYNRIIETNIRNLAGVPSIIYGMLGLAIFVRVFDDFTGGRTILAAGLTMALLILPIIIVNSQEALRAVPWSIREASYGIGATKWQTISRQVLPAAVPGIMTGTILAMSRAVGETAPLIVVGAATFLTVDPTGPLSRFTALPIQIWYWTQQPNDQFRNVAAAAILVLLVLLLTMNSFAIILRNRAQRARV
ncbi:MAG: phosphate ABC transporter permease PstA [Aggregatilineales bacterium]